MNNLIHIDQLSFLIDLPKQGANAFEHFAGTMTVSYYVIQSCPDFIVIRWNVAKKLQRCTAVHYDCCQGLFYFMSNRSGNRLHVH